MHTKKIFQVALAASLTTSAIVLPIQQVQAAPKFSDIGSSSIEMQDAIMNLVERKVISGYPDGTFKPAKSITRTQAAKILAGALKLDTKNIKNPNFKDVPVSDPNYPYIAALANKGIINGSNGKFNPQNPITRGQMAKMIVKGFDLPLANGKLPFTDVPANSEYVPYIQTLYSNAITTGKTATTYDPQGHVSRGHLVVFVTRSEKVKGGNTPELSGTSITLRAKDYKLAYIQAYYGGRTTAKDAVFKWDEASQSTPQSITLRPTKEGTSKLIISGASLQGNPTGNDTAYLAHVKKVNGALHLTLEKVNEALHAENEDFYSSFDAFNFNPSKVTVSTLDGKTLPSSD
ncbi:MAG: S-layer homology domain-containing protein, partial [Lysinibacillus sp.]